VNQRDSLTQRQILLFWAPLAATWLMMSVEGPFLAAIIARLGRATYNLAAFGVAFSLAMLMESPIIMMTSAVTALARDRQSFLALRRFAYALNLLISCIMGVLLVPPVFRLVAERLIGLPHDVAALTHVATAILLPWPAAIGYRRFYQGLLIRNHLTRRVAYGTVVRVGAMMCSALALYALTRLPGAWVAAAALSCGVTGEAVASRIMARRVVRGLRAGQEGPAPGPPLAMTEVIGFYFPLALTSLMTMGVNPLVTFFLGHSRRPLESLAVMPVVASLVFAFRSAGVAYQEVGIALLGEREEGFVALRRFAARLAVILAGALTVVAFSPLATVWFHSVSGLSAELTRFARVPLRVLCVIPGLEAVLAFQRARLVHGRRTALVTWASGVEVAGILAALTVGIGLLDLVGALAAAIALLTGRASANLFLLRPALAERRSEWRLRPAGAPRPPTRS
jgi:hypothetical protein